MGLFKKIRRIVHPGSRLFDKRGDGGKGYEALGTHNAHQADLDAAMKDYEGIPASIRNQYTASAKRAGTYADTGEFNSGLNSEVNAGVRGARVNAVARINSLRKIMGNNEEFKPEGFDQTQANNTQTTLANQPAPEEAPEPSVDADGGTSAFSANSTTSVQNGTNSLAQRRLAALRAVQG